MENRANQECDPDQENNVNPSEENRDNQEHDLDQADDANLPVEDSGNEEGDPDEPNDISPPDESSGHLEEGTHAAGTSQVHAEIPRDYIRPAGYHRPSLFDHLMCNESEEDPEFASVFNRNGKYCVPRLDSRLFFTCPLEKDFEPPTKKMRTQEESQPSAQSGRAEGLQNSPYSRRNLGIVHGTI